MINMSKGRCKRYTRAQKRAMANKRHVEETSFLREEEINAQTDIVTDVPINVIVPPWKPVVQFPEGFDGIKIEKIEMNNKDMQCSIQTDRKTGERKTTYFMDEDEPWDRSDFRDAKAMLS